MWNSNIAVTKEKETFTSRKYLFTFLGILWDVLCVYESHILDESPFLDFNWHLSLIYWNFIFKEKMINLPRLMDTILEWRGSNCFGHHYFMHFKMKQTKPGSLLRLCSGSQAGHYLGPGSLDRAANIQLRTHNSSSHTLFTPHLDFSSIYIYFTDIWHLEKRKRLALLRN